MRQIFINDGIVLGAFEIQKLMQHMDCYKECGSQSAQKTIQMVEKAKPKRKTISELFADFEGEYVPIKMDWGEPEGTEIW